MASRSLLLSLVALSLSLFGCQPPAAAASSTRAPDVSVVYPQVIESIALIEVEGRLMDDSSNRVMTAGGVGSGVLISADGDVLTAAHVVHTADRIKVTFSSGVSAEAKVVRSDPAADVALIKLARVPDGAKPVKLGDSDKMSIGEQVFVVGAPLGISHSLTVGHLSARRAPAALRTGLSDAELFQTDAAINQGNSGGPLFNMRGEVVGIVSHLISLTGGFEGLGFAVTSNAARELLTEDSAFWSGLSGYLLSGHMAEIFNLPQANGLLVQVVAKGSPAERLGLKGGDVKAKIGGEQLLVGGDVILEIQGMFVTADDNRRIRERLSSMKAGEPLQVKILRNGEVSVLKGEYAAP